MFEKLRQSIDDLLAAHTKPEERRAIAARMKETLVHARMGLDDLRAGVAQTRTRLELEQRELETVRRRRTLAEGIGDAETVKVASQFEQRHDERAQVLGRKLAAQEEELALAEREVESMTADFRAAIQGSGAGSAAPGARLDPSADALDPLAADRPDPSGEIDALGRQRRRSEQEAAADARLAELKRRMGQ